MVRWATVLILVGCWLHATGAAKADYIPWTFNGFDAAGYDPNTGGYTLNRAVIGGHPDSMASIAFGDPTVLPNHGSGNASLTVATLRSFPDRSNEFHNGFYGRHGTYHLSLHLTDDTSGTAGTFFFQGGFDSPSDGRSIRNFLDAPSQSLRLGNSLYTVTLGAFDIPSVTETRVGSISASVDVQAATAPEPSTLVLAGLGASSLVVAAWRRRRRNACPSA